MNEGIKINYIDFLSLRIQIKYENEVWYWKMGKTWQVASSKSEADKYIIKYGVK